MVRPCAQNTKPKWNPSGSGNNLNELYKRSVWQAQGLSLGWLTVRASAMKPAQSMILPILLSASLWPPLGTVYTHLAEPEIAFTQLSTVFKHQSSMFKQTSTFKPSEFQALNIKLDYGTSPEPQRLSRREKIALKLTQITKTTTY